MACNSLFSKGCGRHELSFALRTQRGHEKQNDVSVRHLAQTLEQRGGKHLPEKQHFIAKSRRVGQVPRVLPGLCTVAPERRRRALSIALCTPGAGNPLLICKGNHG